MYRNFKDSLLLFDGSFKSPHWHENDVIVEERLRYLYKRRIPTRLFFMLKSWMYQHQFIYLCIIQKRYFNRYFLLGSKEKGILCNNYQLSHIQLGHLIKFINHMRCIFPEKKIGKIPFLWHDNLSRSSLKMFPLFKRHLHNIKYKLFFLK